MTKKLESLFNLPDSSELADVDTATDSKKLIEENYQSIREIDSTIDKIDSALPIVRDLDAADQELDELSALAKSTAEDLINLGMNVEARFSGQILQTAGVLLGHAITAKQAKIDKKLRMVDLQLKKMRLDQASENAPAKPMEGQAVVLDRNELLKQILSDTKDQKKLQ